MSAEVKKIEEKPEKVVENREKIIKLVEEGDIKEKEIDELKQDPEKSVGKRIREQWQLILKLVELLLCVLCFAFYYQPAKQSANIAKPRLEQVGLIFLSFNGYMLINLVFIVSRFIKDKIPYRTSALFSLIAALLLFMSGIIILVDRKENFPGIIYEPHVYLTRMLSASSAFSFVNAIVFTVDARYTYSLKADF